MNKKLCVLLPLILTFCNISQALMVLTVDFTNPSAVVITATGNNSLVTARDSKQNGFQLYNAIPNNTDNSGNFQGNVISTIRPDGTGSNIATGNASYADSSQTGGLSSLLIYSSQIGNWVVTEGEAAFSGSITLDLSDSLIGTLPSPGASGNVVLGYTTVSGVIGTWSAISSVPEPSHYAIILSLFLSSFIFWKRRNVS